MNEDEAAKGSEAAPASHTDLSSTPPARATRADVGAALRSAFKATVDESVPDELLDLLRKLD